MKIWLDLCNPKDVIFANLLKNEFERLGYTVIITAREDTQIIGLLEHFKLQYTLIGDHGGSALSGKLRAFANGVLGLLNYFEGSGNPDVCWAHASVDGMRTAFGLGIPIVCNNDTLQNTPTVKLTVPLANYLIIPEAYEKKEWSKIGLEEEKIIVFRGIEEVAWVKDIRPDREKIVERYIGKDVDRFVVVRNIEYKANYSLGAEDNTDIVLKRVSKYATVVYLPRYKEDYLRIKGLKNVIIPKEYLSHQNSLLWQT